ATTSFASLGRWRAPLYLQSLDDTFFEAGLRRDRWVRGERAVDRLRHAAHECTAPLASVEVAHDQLALLARHRIERERLGHRGQLLTGQCAHGSSDTTRHQERASIDVPSAVIIS